MNKTTAISMQKTTKSMQTEENKFYREVTKEEAKWVPSRINQGWEMTRVNPKSNYVEVRLLKWFERIYYWKF